MALTAYVFEKALGDNAEGDVVQLDADEAQPLIDAGFIREASAEDISGGAETDDEYNDVAMTNAVSGLSTKLEQAVTRATEKALSKMSKPVASPRLSVPAETKKEPAIKSMGDLFRQQFLAMKGDRTASNKLAAYQAETKAATGQGEASGSIGGYALKQDWSDTLFDKDRGEADLYSMVTNEGAPSGNTYNMPYFSESSRANASRWGGLQSFYAGEGVAMTGSKPAYGNLQLVLKKLYVYCFMTNELLADNSYNLDKRLQEIIGSEIFFKKNDGIVNGAGTTEPTGLLNQAALVTVTAAGGAATVLFADIAKMWARLYIPSRKNAVWLVNQQVEQQLIQMAFTSGGTTSAHGLTYNVADEFPLRLMGKPVLPIEAAGALGTVGDIILCDLSQLIAIEKGITSEISTDFSFNTDETVFRVTFRWDLGSPWAAALTPYKGAQTVSPFIVLGNRGT